MNDEELSVEAYRFIKTNKQQIIERFCSSCKSVATPVSIFMAGSPGAGKTEVSRSLSRRFKTIPVRIDADEIRALCPSYIGANAHVFQRAANKGVNMLYDHVLEHRMHAILDGTFAYAEALRNIQRSIDRNRKVELWFIYQDPIKAWEFTKAREVEEARHVNKETFIHGYLMSRQNAIQAKEEHNASLVLNLLIQNVDNSDGVLRFNIKANELDRYIGSVYTEDDLNKLLV